MKASKPGVRHHPLFRGRGDIEYKLVVEKEMCEDNLIVHLKQKDDSRREFKY